METRLLSAVRANTQIPWGLAMIQYCPPDQGDGTNFTPSITSRRVSRELWSGHRFGGEHLWGKSITNLVLCSFDLNTAQAVLRVSPPMSSRPMSHRLG